MHRPFHCPHCRRDSQLVTPAPWTRLLLVFAWFHAALLVACAAMLGPFLLLVVPFVMAFGVGLITGAHQLAGAPPTCARCEKIVPRVAAAAPARVMPVEVVRAA
jgi:hypothetical protein